MEKQTSNVSRILIAAIALLGAVGADRRCSGFPIAATGTPPEQVAPASDGWCCVGGKVEPASQRLCAVKKGRYFNIRQEADRACQAPSKTPGQAPSPTPSQDPLGTPGKGLCCVNGLLQPMEAAVCQARGGRSFERPEEAEGACRGAGPQPEMLPLPPGVCCLDGRIEPLPPSECGARRGRFFERPEEAERVCRGEGPRPETAPPQGVCCFDGRVEPMPPAECQARRGRFFERPEDAERICRGEGPRPEMPRVDQRPELQPIIDATARMSRYHFRISYSSGHVFDGEMDTAERIQHYTIAVDERGPLAEIFWNGEAGLGHRLDSDGWFKLSGRPMVDYLQAAAASLAEGEVVEVRPAGDRTTHVLRANPVGPLDPATRHELATLDCCGDTTRFLGILDTLAAGARSQAEIRVSNRDQAVRGYAVTITGSQLNLRVEAEFMPIAEQVPRPPGGVATGPEAVPANALAITISTLGGWVDIKTHSPWAQRSLDLIQSSDTKGEYAEIYDPSWSTTSFTETLAMSIGDKTYEATGADWFKIYHPIVLSAYHEDEADRIMPDFYKKWFKDDANYKNYQAKGTDYYWSSTVFRRDSHHYGAWGDGLEWQWYFKLVPNMPATIANDRYYSARDWGYGGNRLGTPPLNRLTFTEAIKQYNQYTLSGKKRAYLMLGHPAHLLQDSGHPDHAAVVPHPASGMTQPEAFERFKYCEFVGAQASLAAAAACSTLLVGAGICALVACPAAYGLAYETCRQAADASLVGYERLVADHWRTTGWFGNTSGVDATIDKAGPLMQKTYDAFFDDLGTYSKSKLSTYGLSNPVGCSSLTVTIGLSIPAANPAIDRYKQSATLSYLKYSDDVLPRIIGSTAGFIQHFYQIVNYPPFVERFAVVQWEPGATPRGYGTFSDDQDDCLRYDATWTTSGTARALTLSAGTATPKLVTDRPAYVFMRFGPTDIGPIKGGKKMASVVVKATHHSASTTITMKAASDDEGVYYWGSFEPTNCTKDNYQLTFEIIASDSAPHLQTRTYPGNEIDSNPATVATADAGSEPTYPWVNYETGADTNHVIWVQAFSESATAVPPKIKLDPRNEKAEVTIKAKMAGLDCHWEPIDADPKCITGWKINDTVTSLTKTGVSGPSEDFGFAMAIKDDRAAATVIRFWLAPGLQKRYKPGTYRVEVEAVLATNAQVTAPTVSIEVTLL